jgi:hypothetical protein
MTLGGALGDEQPLADLAVRKAGCHQDRHLALPPAQGPRIDHGFALASAKCMAIA